VSGMKNLYVVMPGPVPGIHVLLTYKDVDGRDNPRNRLGRLLARQRRI
jgi:hypothetical protein